MLPLAGRMGMHDMREELEDLAFRNLMPEAYETITKRLADLGKKSGTIITKIEKDLKERLTVRDIHCDVKGRQKSPYSVWRKMERKRVSFEQLSDIFGFRVIVGDVEQCYRALGVVHTAWAMVPGRFKDYISTPKQNDYRSIHTTVVGPRSQRVELQLRTQTMDSFAEYGIAAHALYKDGLDASDGSSLEKESLSYQWLKRTVALLTEDDNPDEFLEHTKLELFHDQVFCFTPKGRLIALPRSATPIDFAYAVHTDVGHSAIGCKINGRTAPLTSELSNGDEVEIIAGKGHVPPAAWESLVVTGKARAAIRRATRDATRKQYAGLGRQIVERAFERATRVYSDEKVKAILHRLARPTLEDVMADVGRGEMYSGDILKAVYPDAIGDTALKSQAPKPEPGWFDLDQGKNLKFKIPNPGKEAELARAAIPVRGLEAGMPVQFAPQSGAVPGDRIIGILTPGQGVTIYPIQSSALAAFENELERWLDVRWDIDGAKTRRFPARIIIKSLNEPGTLAQIAAIIAEHDGNIDNVKMSRRANDFTETVIDLAVWDLKHLNAIISQLRARPVINSAERIVD